MKIVSFRLSDREYEALQRQAGPGRGALSKFLRRLIAEPKSQIVNTFNVASNTANTAEAIAAGREIARQIAAYDRRRFL
jgi:hypothetical protein